MRQIVDSRFKVVKLRAYENPNQTTYMALHNDYSEDPLSIQLDDIPSEEKCGEIVVNRLLKGDRGHFGCLEHAHITFSCENFPHSVIVQARTHRIGCSFDVQSQRYTGKRINRMIAGELEVEDIFYCRPVGEYYDRKGTKYYFSEGMRHKALIDMMYTAYSYDNCVKGGMAEEHARDVLAQGIRQNMVVTFNARSLCHFFDLRSKADAQPEIIALCEYMKPYFCKWMPQVADWYLASRWGKAKLSP